MADPKLCVQLTVDSGLDWMQHKAGASQGAPCLQKRGDRQKLDSMLLKTSLPTEKHFHIEGVSV